MSEEQSLIPVVMNLTNQDIANASKLQKRHRLSNGATAVSLALGIANDLHALLDAPGTNLLVFNPSKPEIFALLTLPGRPA
jgi:hypothetical protein